MFTQLLIMLIVTLVVIFIRYLNYAIKGIKCVNINNFIKNGTNDKFEEIINNIYAESEKEVKSARFDTLVIDILTQMLVILGMSFPIIAFTKYAQTLSKTFKIVILVISVFLLLASLYSYTYKKRYKMKYLYVYKKLILNAYIRKMNAGFAYDMNSTISRETYEKLGLNDEVIDYFGQDHLTGVVDGRRNLNISRLYVKSIEKQKTKKFCGLFGYASTDIEDDVLIEEINSFKNNKDDINNNGNIEFFKYYTITTNDEKTKLKILENKQLIDYIINFRKEYNLNVQIIIKDNKTYIKIYTGDIFEPRVYKYWENKKRLWAFFLLVKYIADVTEMLKTLE